MKDLLKFVGLCIIIAMQSCTSDLEPTVPDNSEPEVTITHMVAKYGDKVYETDVKNVGDSVEYLNEEYAELYRTQISKMPDLAATLTSDENGVQYIEYFPSEKTLLEKFKVAHMENSTEEFDYPITRGVINLLPPAGKGPILCRAELYDDRNFKDTELITYATTSWAGAVPKLKDYGFNDKASSIKVFNEMTASTSYTITYYEEGSLTPKHRTHYGSQLRPVLVCHHNSDFKGVVIYCIAPPTGQAGEHSDTNLKSIGWNDRISSIGIQIIFDLSVFEKHGDEEPVIPAHPTC